MRIVTAVAVGLWLLLTGVVAPAEDAEDANPEESSGTGLYLASLKVLSGALSAPVDAKGALVLDLHTADTGALRAKLGQIAGLELSNESTEALRVRVLPDAHFLGEPSERDHQATWVIDYDQPSISALSNLWREESQESAADTDAHLQALIAFTGAQIDDPNYRNGLLIASQVARRREGDCTEYGVLQTALARGAGHASRLIFGLLMIAENNELQAYGHAWAEIHHGGKWHVADATQPWQPGVQGVWHLPISVFDNEGPGHIFELVKFAKVRPNLVTLISTGAVDEPDTQPDHYDD